MTVPAPTPTSTTTAPTLTTVAPNPHASAPSITETSFISVTVVGAAAAAAAATTTNTTNFITLAIGRNSPGVPSTTTTSSNVDSVPTCLRCDRTFASHTGLVDGLQIHRTETG
nr:unnamed protein product [Spirometra erinaceieuropaei]